MRFIFCAVILLGGTLVQAAVPELYVDCRFTGIAGEHCRTETEAWAKAKHVKVHIEHGILTSTEKLALYSKVLSSKDPKLDVFGVDVIWPGILHKDLLDLEPYFKKEISEYVSTYIQNNTINDRLVAIPFTLHVGLLFYRADLLAADGLPVPTTWEQLTEEAAKIQEDQRERGKSDFWGFVFQGKAYEGLTCNALEWLASHNGGTLMDRSGRVLVNTSNVQDALTLAGSWVGKISPPEVLNFAEAESHDFFREGKAAFLRDWPSAWAIVNDPKSPVAGKVGVAVLPRGGARGMNAGALGGWSLAVSAKTKYPELAVDLLKHLTAVAQERKLAMMGGGAPTLTKLYDDAEIMNSASYYRVLMPAFKAAILRPSHIVRNYYPDVSRELWTTAHAVLARKKPVLEAMSELQNKLTVLSKHWRK